MKTNVKLREITHKEFCSLQVGETVYVKIGEQTYLSKITRAPFYNSDSDEPDWEVETENGFCDENSLYVAVSDTDTVTKKKTAKDLYVKEIETAPISTDYVNSDNKFYWYKVESSEDVEVIREHFSLIGSRFKDYGIQEPTQYPEYICIEDTGNSCCCYLLSDMKRMTEEFWKIFGMSLQEENKEERRNHLS